MGSRHEIEGEELLERVERTMLADSVDRDPMRLQVVRPRPSPFDSGFYIIVGDELDLDGPYYLVVSDSADVGFYVVVS